MRTPAITRIEFVNPANNQRYSVHANSEDYGKMKESWNGHFIYAYAPGNKKLRCKFVTTYLYAIYYEKED